MTEKAGAPLPSVAGPIAAGAIGILLGLFGFLAAAARAMASAPMGWRGSIPDALFIVGVGLAALGLVSLAVPCLRAAAKLGPIAALIAVAGLIVYVQLA